MQNEKHFPKGFIESIKNAPGFDEKAFALVHQSSETITSIRLNPFKKTATFENCDSVNWCDEGKYLKERPSFTNDPLFHAGCYYVQEASSMFVSYVFKSLVDTTKQLRILDLCAAPGGKSTLLASLISSNSLLISNEVIKARAGILLDNIVKWGLLNTFVSNNDPKDIAKLKGYFDVILVDAPCSGSGLFRKDEKAMDEWSEENVVMCSQRQQRILADIMPALKTGGLLIYSTCSYSTEEDEAIADWLVNDFEMQNQKIEINKDWNIVETQSPEHKSFGCRFYPDKLKGEGFFLAAFTKTQIENCENFKAKTTLQQANKNEVQIIFPWLKPNADYFVFKHKEEFYLINSQHQNDVMFLLKNIYLKKSAVRLGKIMGKDFIPDHELALSTAVSEGVPRIEVDKDTALLYLKKQNFTVDTKNTGWHLITFQNNNLGWVKILPNRINNYLPKDWRILRDIVE